MVNKNNEAIALRLGSKVSARRKQLKWTQAELSERLGVSTETISRIERGAVVPSLHSLYRLAEILRTRISALVDEVTVGKVDAGLRLRIGIEELSSRDQEFVLEHVQALCKHLRRNSRKT
jgi:transcriptional regulator with XRE-family HTH domain